MGSLGETGISSKYDVDDILLLLETIRVFLVVFVIFILFFLRSVCRCRLEEFAQDRALPHRVVALGVDWAPLVVKDLVILIMRLFILLTTWSAIHSPDSIVRLALARRIPLVAYCCRCCGGGNDCVLTPLRRPNAASYPVNLPLFWGDYARSRSTGIGW